MILDEQAIFSDKQAVTASAASTNTIKVGSDIGKGTPVEIFTQVMTPFAGLTSLKVSVQTCDTENGSYADVSSTDAIAQATLVGGYRFALKFLPNQLKKYVRLYYTVVGTATAGTITSGVADGVPESYHN